MLFLQNDRANELNVHCTSTCHKSLAQLTKLVEIDYIYTVKFS
jgi:hypothetical protein